MDKEVQESGDFILQLLQEIGVITLQPSYLAYPIACLACIYDNGQMLVVGTQHELGEETYFVTVFAFGFHLIGQCSTEVLQPFTVLPAVEQYFIHHDEQFPCPIGIELAAEVLVGIERHIVFKDGFQEVEERAFARVPFFGHEQQDRKFLNRIKVEQLQVVHAQLVLLPEDVFHQRADAGEAAFLRSVSYRLVEVEELSDYGLVTHMVGDGTETVILRHGRHAVFAVVLSQGLGVPCDAFLHTAPVNQWLVNNLVEGCPHADEFVLFCHRLCLVLCRRQQCRQQVKQSDAKLRYNA